MCDKNFFATEFPCADNLLNVPNPEWLRVANGQSRLIYRTDKRLMPAVGAKPAKPQRQLPQECPRPRGL